jgi:hypothetical protein
MRVSAFSYRVRSGPAPITGDDIVRRAGDHLERTIDRVLDEERQPPEATRVTVADFDGAGPV